MITNYFPTTEKVISENYPYGYRLKTVKTDWLEFDPKKGFRHVSQTINPKTGRPNNPKKSVYYDLMILNKHDSGEIRCTVKDYRDLKEINQVAKFLSSPEIFSMFTAAQIEFIYLNMIVHSKVSAKAQVIYCGSKWDDLKTYFEGPLKELTEAAKTRGTENRFNKICFDLESIEAAKVPGFNPFVVTQYETRIIDNRLQLVRV